MSCLDWLKAQDAYPAINHTEDLMLEFGNEAPKKRQLNSDIAEVKSLCDHWNLLEIVCCHTHTRRFDMFENQFSPSPSKNVH